MGGGSVSSQGAELGTSEDRPDLSPLPIVDLQKACTSVGGWAGEQGGHSLLGPWSFPGKLPPLTQGWPPVVQGRGSPCSKHPSCPSGKWFPALLLPQGRSGVSVCHRIQLEVYGRETTLPVASSPVPCPALLPSPLPPTSGPEFRETSPVSGSHLPFLLSREERPPPPRPPCSGAQHLPASGTAGFGRGAVGLGLNPQQSSPSGPASSPTLSAG